MKYLIVIMSFMSVAYASSGEKIRTHLAWKNPKEVVEYHSCGCGDACWVAELKNKKNHQTKLRLKCDCEKLYVSYGTKKAQTLVENSCSDINNLAVVNGKNQAIVTKIEELLKTKKR
jgi:hypothetical protein